MTGSTIVAASALLAALAATSAQAQEGAASDSAAAADSVQADSAAADSLPADSAAAASNVDHGVPSLEGYRKIAILYRDMAPGAPGYETAVEVHRGPERAQVLRFVTRGTPWAYVVRPSGGADSYTLRDFDCSGGYGEELEAGTPLVIPDCAMPETPAPAPAEDDDD
jgi:hypothetical protein